jgi:hypothetical protein
VLTIACTLFVQQIMIIGGESHSLLSRVQLEGHFPHLRLTDGDVTR